MTSNFGEVHDHCRDVVNNLQTKERDLTETVLKSQQDACGCTATN
jgi:hypothetical protein